MVTNLNIFIRENKAYRFHFDSRETTDTEMKRFLRVLNSIDDEATLVDSIKHYTPANKNYVPDATRTWLFKYKKRKVDVLGPNWNQESQTYTKGTLIDEFDL